MSDQNQWPKPGETPEHGSVNGQAPEPGAPSSAAEPESGRSQQYGASAPSDPYPAPGQPQGQPGHQPPQNPYAQPGQSQNPYGQPGQPQNPYAQPGQPQNPYAQPGQPQNPYAQPGHQAPQNPYAQPGQHNPYGQSHQQNPYAQPGQQQGGNPYAQQQNPYAAPGAYASAGYQPYAQRPKLNTLSVLAIVFGLAGVLPFFWFIAILTGPTGAILGHVALGKLKTNGERGRGLALTGVIAGWAVTAIWILVVGLLFATGFTSNRYSDYGSGAFIL